MGTARAVSGNGAFGTSLVVHGLIYGLLVGMMSLHPTVPKLESEYLDLGYQTFDEPPPKAEVEQKVVHSAPRETPTTTKVEPDSSPRELQDENGEVAGTQTAKPQESTLGNEDTGTAEATPYYKIKPKYPRAAAVAGIEGSVLFEVDINEQGEVENIRVIGGEQRNLFQSEAKRALAQWKYKPFRDANGNVIRKADHHVKVEFKLQDSETSGS